MLARRLGLERLAAHDLLELFAFVRPARFCVPTPRGLAMAVGMAPPASLEHEARALRQVTRLLLHELAGVVGCEPGPLTLRELLARYHGAARHAWGQTSSLMAAIMNVNRAKHARAINPVDLMPRHLVRPGDRRQRGMSGDLQALEVVSREYLVSPL